MYFVIDGSRSSKGTSCKLGPAGATVVNTTGLNLTDALSNLGIPNTAGNLTITSVEKLAVKVSDLGLIIN